MEGSAPGQPGFALQLLNSWGHLLPSMAWAVGDHPPDRVFLSWTS